MFLTLFTFLAFFLFLFFISLLALFGSYGHSLVLTCTFWKFVDYFGPFSTFWHFLALIWQFLSLHFSFLLLHFFGMLCFLPILDIFFAFFFPRVFFYIFSFIFVFTLLGSFCRILTLFIFTFFYNVGPFCHLLVYGYFLCNLLTPFGG